MEVLLLALNLLFAGCTEGEATQPPETVTVDVVARVPVPGEPAAWTAAVRKGIASASRALRPGACERARATADNGRPFAEAVTLTGLAGSALRWDDARAAYTVVGPRQSVDPSWGIGDLDWQDEHGARHVAEGVVRFGALPVITFVARDGDGNVHIGWDPATVEQGEVRVATMAGELACGASADGVEIPWWAVPPAGGAVLVRSTRSRVAVVGEDRVLSRSTLELLVPLDEPAEASAAPDPLPPRPAVPRSAPRRSLRPVRGPTG